MDTIEALAALVISISAALSPALYAQFSSSSSTANGVLRAVLPHNVILPRTVVKELFSEITQEASTGVNEAAVGNPKATRMVIYANSDSSQKVTLSVDQYASSSYASSEFQEAVEKSKIVPGFKPLSVPKLGQQVMAGIVAQGTETHVGLGALEGELIVGATLAGYNPTPENIDKLVKLTREEVFTAKKALTAGGSH